MFHFVRDSEYCKKQCKMQHNLLNHIKCKVVSTLFMPKSPNTLVPNTFNSDWCRPTLDSDWCRQTLDSDWCRPTLDFDWCRPTLNSDWCRPTLNSDWCRATLDIYV